MTRLLASVVRINVVLASVALAIGAPCAAQPSAQPATGSWLVTAGVTFAPWRFEIAQSGVALTGTVRQSGGITTPSTIKNGVVRGNTITFAAESPSGGRSIAFAGTMFGDSIVFTRSVDDPAGTVGGAGIFGANGAMRFTAVRNSATPDIPTREVAYKGYTIDISAIATAADRDSVLDAVRGQLDLVDGVRFSDEALRFMKSVPLVMATTSGSAAYGNGRVIIPIHSSAPYDKTHPILLHELCHAYHDKRLPDGIRNADVLALYDAARRGGKFPAGSYMLSKPGEYFAMIASVYLYGTAARDPFTRGAIKEKQPEMYAFLVKTFGAR